MATSRKFVGIDKQMKSTGSIFTGYKRLPTLEVKAGALSIGNNAPVRIQTMTTTDTMDTLATVEESIRCIEAGAELIRITAPSKREAENLLNIRNELRRRGYDTPLVADIHFTPNAAEIAARIVEKVRINPGNYVDKKKFELLEYSDADYNGEIDRIRTRFTPLIRICKEYGTAMRIGTNHGSLSDRIMSRYGDTAIGMVESAMEFLRIAEAENYYNIVLSMKSSNPIVMIEAYRLLVQNMYAELGHCYPLHLGVTEAGDGDDGRIKSAIGIGTLLEEGIGDTIRVSLTEDPELELPVCKNILKRYQQVPDLPATLPEYFESETFVNRPVHQRKSFSVRNAGGEQVPVVVADLSNQKSIIASDLAAAGYFYDAVTDKWNLSDMAADYIFCGDTIIDFAVPGTLGIIYNFNTWQQYPEQLQASPLLTSREYVDYPSAASLPVHFVLVGVDDLLAENAALLSEIKTDGTAILCFDGGREQPVQALRRNFRELEKSGIQNPVVLFCQSSGHQKDDVLIETAIETGALLTDGMGNGIWLRANQPLKWLNSIAFGILQAARARISKTEYISCPSCGRTLFDLQETTARIRAVTHHLKGVKIGIMGCIVNGPGEMADAHFGYVGSGPGKITLYKGQEVVKRNVPAEIAVEELIELLKENNAWVEPAAVSF